MNSKIIKAIFLGALGILMLTPSCLKDSKSNQTFGPFPAPSEQFMKDVASLEEIGFDYLDKYFSAGEREFIQTYDDCDSCVCAWVSEFEEGIFYKYYDCNEWGYEVSILFELENLTKQNVVDLIDHLFVDPNNSWNADTTRYEPKDADAGCYYELTPKGSGHLLNYYCRN